MRTPHTYQTKQKVMPLSKAKNKERMRKIRLHALLDPPTEGKPLQPKEVFRRYSDPSEYKIVDADGNLIPEYE